MRHPELSYDHQSRMNDGIGCQTVLEIARMRGMKRAQSTVLKGYLTSAQRVMIAGYQEELSSVRGLKEMNNHK